MEIIIGLIILAKSIVTIDGPDFIMSINDECSQVIIDSGYTEAIDIHKYVTPTPEYVEACF